MSNSEDSKEVITAASSSLSTDHKKEGQLEKEALLNKPFRGKRKLSVSQDRKRKKSTSSGDESHILPNTFLFGGNISDPLNLKAMIRGESDCVDSGSPTKKARLIPKKPDRKLKMLPANFKDPLRLVTEGPIVKTMKVRKKKKQKIDTNVNSDTSTAATLNNPTKQRLLETGRNDQIVSPAVAQDLTMLRTVFESGSQPGAKVVTESMVKAINFKSGNSKYRFGNYHRYYGYRCDKKFSDPRMEYLLKDWFKDKDVLDVGCNSGQLTLLVARDYGPRKIVGIDIDDKLIVTARSNIRHYATTLSKSQHLRNSEYPADFLDQYGPSVAPPQETGTGDSTKFPNNVIFHQGNYVPEAREVLDCQEPEYDVIMCLSVTKWLHLNWGDDGLKRTFKRMYKQLRAGGKLIIEPQDWKSYGKKKKLTETIFRNYHQIKLKPQHFAKYLVDEVGFIEPNYLKCPQYAGGFQRAIIAFTKPE